MPPSPPFSLGILARSRVCAVPVSPRHYTPRDLLRILYSPGPGADGGVAAAVGVQDRQRVGGARLAGDRDEHAAAAEEGFENSPVVRLKADAAHRAGNAERGEIARRSLQRLHERAARDDWPGAG